MSQADIHDSHSDSAAATGSAPETPGRPPFWEKGYGDMSVSTMGGPNHDIVELASALPPRARVLDLGCGEGRNAFFLAGRGHRVKAVDISAKGIRKVERLAARAGFEIETEVADLNDFRPTGSWDAILAHGVIDYLENPVWRELVGEIRAHTAPGGWNAYTCMLFTEAYPAPPEFLKAEFKHSIAPFELAGVYGDWEIVRHDRYVKWDQHPGIPIHCHPVDKLTARRPGGDGPAPRIEMVPIGDRVMPRDQFDGIDMGMDAAELLARCGEPAVIDRTTMDGVQLGVGPNTTVDGYHLSLWYYGSSVIYVVNDRVWGRALYNSVPIRVHFDER